MKWPKTAILVVFLNTLLLSRTIFGEITKAQNVNQNSNTDKSEKKGIEKEETTTEIQLDIETNSESGSIKLTEVS